MNPLYSMFGGQPQTPMPGAFGNLQNLVSQYQQFRQQFQGDPRQQIQNLLSTGRMTPQQYAQLQQMAQQLQNVIR